MADIKKTTTTTTKTTKTTVPTKTVVTTKTAAPAKTVVTTKTAVPTKTVVTTKTAVPTKTVVTSKTAVPAKTVVTSKTAVPAKTVVTTKPVTTVKRTVSKVDDSEINVLLTENIEEVIIVLHNDFSVEFVSGSAERILGIDSEDIMDDLTLLGQCDYVADDVVTYSTLKRLQTGDSVSYIVSRVHGKTKDKRYYVDKITAIELNGVRKYSIVISDHTAELITKNSLEEALRIAQVANKSRNAYLETISQEIRTPLTTIAELCAQIQNTSDPEKLQEYVGQLVMTGRHTLTLMNDILNMSKVETGANASNVTEISVMDLIREINAAASPRAKNKKVRYKNTVAVKADKILGDSYRIKRVFNIILANAIKHTPEDGNVEFSVQQVHGPDRKYVYFQFMVRDDGMGMSEDLVKNLFRPYYRDITAKLNGSMGLNLAVAKSIVDGMGGNITVESEEGEGTTFIVNLKFPVSKMDEADFWKAHGIQRVLIVGTNNVENSSIIWGMRNSEVSISSAKTLKLANAAIDKTLADGKGFNLVILDWQNGIIDGLESFRGLRKVLPDYILLVILAASDEEVKAARGAGARAVIKKPFTVKAFQDCIGQLKADFRESIMPVTDKGVLEDKHFLVAEDNETSALLLSELLSAHGASCVIKTNGKDAVDEFVHSAKGQYDGILMDVVMPEMDGFQAARLIRKSKHPNSQTVPIIVVTSKALAKDVRNALADGGIDDYIMKPVDIYKLEAAYQSSVDKR